ncbi:MAG: CDP-glucose 4,6-dehydratase [Candidatus Planktophila sp.]|nr:CDP-glucose 4,6-dehydratase [Candidatus Planktophila sp.]
MANFLKDYSGKKILVTGHTGFKGAWLSRILVLAGADVFGLALEAETNSLFDVAGDLGLKESSILDIRDLNAVENYFMTHRFDGIFHLAAQPLVRRSYKEPIETFETNVMGTAHILNAAVSNKATHWVVAITTDKVYRNVEKLGGYSEDEPLGGRDPYSASKAATEMVVSAWQTIASHSDEKISICSARAGNVIGGGDTAEDRLIPDLIRGFHTGEKTIIRNPDSIRPWQHVLDPLNGYLTMGSALIAGRTISGAFNFGPGEESKLTVAQMADYACTQWEDSKGVDIQIDSSSPHEAGLLWLSSELATKELGWSNRFEAYEAIRWTIDWEKESMQSSPLAALDRQIFEFYGAQR